MTNKSSAQDLNQASLFFTLVTSSHDTITESIWTGNYSSSSTENWNLVPLSPKPTTDWFGLHKIVMEVSGLQLPPILISPVILLLAMTASELTCRLVISQVISGLCRSILLDFLAAGEASLLSWELLTLFHAYGLPVWSVFTYLTLVAKAYRYRVDCVACPYSHILSCLTGQQVWQQAILRICSQLAAGSAYFHLLASIWDLGLSPIHVYRSYWMAYGRCASWLEVATWAGFLYECFGSLLCGLWSSLIYDIQLWPRLSLHVRILANSLITLAAVLVAFYHTGGFFQPLLAYSRTFGCVGMLREVSLVDHILVYWVGATAGAVAALYMSPMVKRILLFLLVKLERKRIGESESPIGHKHNI
jgi:hypothetical protein